MHTEIAAFVRERHLPPELVGPLQALVARLASGALVASPGAESTVVLADTDDHGATPTSEGAPGVSGTLPARYDDLGKIGLGGTGEVRRVRDRELGRTCAYKVLRGDLAGKPNVVARFVEEAQVAAQLQHPNIAPVYDAGRLPDGRTWFTMKEVRGRTLTDLIREIHAAEGRPTDAAFRRLCDVFAKVCDGVGYAHARGVVHRDLKPANVMVGAHGEVLVLDWGLAKVVGRPARAMAEGDPESQVASIRSGDDAQKTRAGGVLGTAAYMPPEQARGQVDELDARSDVYALGAILYEVLTGRPPYVGRDARGVLGQVLAGPPEAPAPRRDAEGPGLPEELVALCQWCMARPPSDRPAHGAVVADAARAWLDGATRREKALEVVARADAVVTEMGALRARAAALRAEGDALLADTEPWEPEEVKAPGWARQDEAERAERRAALLELKREALLQGALTHASELVEAHAALAELELERHRAAEEAREDRPAARAEVRLREHVDALQEGHEVRRRVATYLRGDGALTLVTEAPGAEVQLLRYEVHHRRLVPVPVRDLGRTPLRAVSLPMGSYLCLVHPPGGAEAGGRPVRYPVSIGRGEHWDGVAPGEREPRPVRLPLVGQLGDDDRLVPAGWSWSGGDPQTVDSLPRRRLWCDDLVVKRFPVTNRQYLLFLDDLVATGREAEALRHAPHERGSMAEAPQVYGRDEAGRFVLRPDADGDLWHPDWPVFLVDWFGASAYAAWLAARTGVPWRLLGELEWEKAARGVDGRFYPWGDGFDPSWCTVRVSQPVRPLPQVVDSYPVDESVYGVRGLGGNVEDWCVDVFRREGPALDGDRVPAPERQPSDGTSFRMHRGGLWTGSPRNARAALRLADDPRSRDEGIGLRVAFRPG